MNPKPIYVLVSSLLVLLAGSPAALGQEEEPGIVTTYPAITGERIYLVEEGDTLWSIAETFFDDAHFWPILWAFNPQITNPHWIYPGDWVIIVPKNLLEQGPALVWAKSRYSEKPTQVAIASRSIGFIPEQQFKESGKIRYSREEKEMLGQYDEVYIEFYIPKKIRLNEEFTVYRVDKEVFHPITKKRVGYKVRHLGTTKVLGTEKRFVKGLLFATYEEIHRDDLVTDAFQHQFVVHPRQNRADIDACIIDTFYDTTYIGEHHYVFIDKGRNDGVVVGNQFVVVQSGDGFAPVHEGDAADLPSEIVGEIMIVEPYERTSLGVVTRSISELTVGQKCEMRVGYGDPAKAEKK
jgi:hypothetical protein